jgi:bacillithiol system protein YtxJ
MMGILKNWIENIFDESPGSEDVSFDEIVEQLAEGDQLLIFKVSPRCFTSLMIERVFDKWYMENRSDNLKLVKVNVITQRPLCNMISERYKIVHESPQLIWLDHSEKVKWHGSHHSITVEVLDDLLDKQRIDTN